MAARRLVVRRILRHRHRRGLARDRVPGRVNGLAEVLWTRPAEGLTLIGVLRWPRATHRLGSLPAIGAKRGEEGSLTFTKTGNPGPAQRQPGGDIVKEHGQTRGRGNQAVNSRPSRNSRTPMRCSTNRTVIPSASGVFAPWLPSTWQNAAYSVARSCTKFDSRIAS